MKSDTELEALVGSDPGHAWFPDLADRYRQRGDYQGAFDLCFNGLTLDPGNHRGRLVLARLFYERLQFPFAVRELKELRRQLPENKYLIKLLDCLAPGEVSVVADNAAAAESIVSAVDFDFGEIELLEEEKNGN